MHFILRQKLLAVGDDFEAFDENGNLAYYFDGKVMSIGKKVLILDPSGIEIGWIRQKLLTFRRTFGLTVNHQRVALIYKKLFSFRPCFVIKPLTSHGDAITVVGKFLEHEYDFYRGNEHIASLKKKWFQGSDSYGLTINQGNPLTILSCSVVIDLICHPKRDSGFSNSRR